MHRLRATAVNGIIIIYREVLPMRGDGSLRLNLIFHGPLNSGEYIREPGEFL